MTVPDTSARGLSRRNLLGLGGLAAASVLGAGGLSGCGVGKSTAPGLGGGNKPAGGKNGEVGGAVTWGSWANPGEAERFQKYSKHYEEVSGTKVTFQNVVGDYQAKILTQLAGGSAPDCFYVGDTMMPTLIEKNAVMDLTDYLNSPDAAVKADDPFAGLAGWTKGPDGKGIYGMPVDCNPYVTWFNKDMLNAAGVDQDPAQAFEAGTWNLDTMTNMLDSLRKAGKRPLVFEAGWSLLCSWITTFGGTAFDDNGQGDPVFNEDPKAMEMITWLFDQMKSKNIVYAGSLPKGQGADALFYAEQLAMYQVGRWILPNLKKLKFSYDIAPFPTAEGKGFKPVAVATAAMSVNAKSQQPDVALAFLGHFVNADGQRFRLSGGGNAVPCVSGLDEVVTEGNLPKHGAWFLEVAKVGYAVPPAVIRDPKVGVDFGTKMDEWLKAGKDTPKSFADKLVNLIMNGEGS